MPQSCAYKTCIIVAFALFDATTGFWSGLGDISWQDGEERQSRKIFGPERQFTSRHHAESAIIEEAKEWVDENRV